MRLAALVLASIPCAVGAIWLVNAAAGTIWAVPLAITLVAIAFFGDRLEQARHPRTTPLQRFEQREQRRRAA